MKTLIPDDEPGNAHLLGEILSNQRSPLGTDYCVDYAYSVEEANDKVSRDMYDLVIVDMYWARSGSTSTEREPGGLAILERLVRRCEIAIVLTAYGTIRNCVKAMRIGAWDYIERRGDFLPELLISIEQAVAFKQFLRANPQRREEDAWIADHLDDLCTEYEGRIVAVLDGRVVDTDVSLSALRQRLQERYVLLQPVLFAVPATKNVI